MAKLRVEQRRAFPFIAYVYRIPSLLKRFSGMLLQRSEDSAPSINLHSRKNTYKHIDMIHTYNDRHAQEHLDKGIHRHVRRHRICYPDVAMLTVLSLLFAQFVYKTFEMQCNGM